MGRPQASGSKKSLTAEGAEEQRHVASGFTDPPKRQYLYFDQTAYPAIFCTIDFVQYKFPGSAFSRSIDRIPL